MTDLQKIEFRKALSEYTIAMGSGKLDATDILNWILRFEKFVDTVASAEVAKIIGQNSKLRIN